jgi:L,D-transpeptidase YnhG
MPQRRISPTPVRTDRAPARGVHTRPSFWPCRPQPKHAIAVDASRSRLYLFENLSPSTADDSLAAAPLQADGRLLHLGGSVGHRKVGRGRQAHTAGRVLHHQQPQPRSLPDLYGVGALPINYPNPLDVQRGKTGSGIWLHGTPKRTVCAGAAGLRRLRGAVQPRSRTLLDTVRIRTTPVVIAPELQWVQPQAWTRSAGVRSQTLRCLAHAKAGRPTACGFYSARFRARDRDLAQWWPRVEAELRRNVRTARELELKDVSMLHWRTAGHHGGDVWRGGQWADARRHQAPVLDTRKRSNGRFS